MKKSLIIFLSCFAINAWSQDTVLSKQIDIVTQHAMNAFDVPGIAVAVVKDGKVIHSQGYGVRSIASKEKVDENTLFGIASNSKAFTTAALALLVDQKKLNWDDKVIQYLPEFKMYNTYVTEEFTIRDLLTHRSGLGLGAGDLMIWPDGHNFTPQDIVNNIQYLKPVSGFRAQYDYDNLLYIIAGLVIERISGISWSEFVETRLMKPIGMTASAGNWNRLTDKSNVIDPHVPIEGKLTVIPRYTNTILDAAGGIYSNVNDLSKWVQLQLNAGNWNGETVFTTARQQEMWAPQTWMPNSTKSPYFSLFKAYGLGWQLTDVSGSLEVSHTGGLEGIVTQITLLPQHGLGIIVLTNQQSGAAFRSITNTVKNYYLKLPYQDFVAEYNYREKQNNSEAEQLVNEVWVKIKNNKKETSTLALNKLPGDYRDAWFGDVRIYKKKEQFIFESKRSKELTGEMHFYKDNQYVVKWFNQSFNADAFIVVEMEQEKVKNFKMEAISPLTDFSYDFQDLHFTPIKYTNGNSGK